jgi:hypothetical protein
MLLAAVFSPVLALCSGMSNPDARAYCDAMLHHESSYCYSISSLDLSTSCRAEVRQDPSICDALQGDARQTCRLRAGGM